MIMKKILFTVLILLFVVFYSIEANAQNETVVPNTISTAVYFDEIPSLKDLPIVDKQYFIDNWGKSVLEGVEHESEGASNYSNWKDEGHDPVWQKQPGWIESPKALIQNFQGQSSPYLPSDANGTVGPNHYMQTVNTTYAIYDKTGTLLAGPTAMNSLFSGVTGSNYNDGDPLILFDEQAQKWVAVEFAISGTPDYMLIAVSQTNDPTGAWWRWSFLMNGLPDYEKMGIWHDGYYMGTNLGSTTATGDDVYVFERSVMLTGSASPQMVGFHNPNRPNNGFHCIMPLDADGASAPSNSPGQFITINDNGWGGNDELRIYDLDVDWITPSNSTFAMTQQISVASFDSQFNAWGVGDIAQPGTTQEVSAQNYTLMTRGQYKNWGTLQSIVCCHTVDVDGTNHAGQRWYELEKTSQTDPTWAIRQQGTYAPDAHSRYNGSIAINDNHEIALGYNISSSTINPNIRYIGQSVSSNTLANGIMDIVESANMAQLSAQSQTSSHRWGDYPLVTVDPVDGVTFWYTNEYYSSGKKTQIVSFTIGSPVLTAQFSGTPTYVEVGQTVTYTDASYGPNQITSYNWTFEGGTPGIATGAGPHDITYNTPGTYDVSLLVDDGSTTDDEIKIDYINAAYSAISTYTAGDIPTDFGFQSAAGASTCPGSLTVSIPSGAIITGVGVEYKMTALSSANAWMSEQVSELRCVSTGGTNEGFLSTGAGTSAGTYSYNRTGLTIANGVSGGGDIDFELHAGRTWGGSGCNTTYNKVDNNTWTVTVYYISAIPIPPVADFTADNTTPPVGQTVQFTDNSSNGPHTWSWTFNPATVSYIGGTNSGSKNPQVQFNNSGYYTVSLEATNDYGSDIEVKTSYILAGTSGNWTGALSTDWNTAGNWETLVVPGSTVDVTIPGTAPNWPTFTGAFTLGTNCNNMTLEGASHFTATGDLILPSGYVFSCNASATLTVESDWNNNGTFNPGTSTVVFDGASNAVIDAAGTVNSSLQTIFTGGNGQDGNMFDIVTSAEAVTITGLDCNVDGSGSVTTEVWYRTDTYVGHSSSTGWTQEGTYTTSAAGSGNPTHIDIGGINIPMGSTYGIYVTTTGSPDFDYTNGANSYNDGTITINAGYGNRYLFSNSFNPRTWNGVVYYSKSGSGGSVTYHNLQIGKNNAEVTNNVDIDITGDLTIKPGAFVTNDAGNTIDIANNMYLQANETDMASFLDEGTTTVGGNTFVEQYISSERWHLVSPPVSGSSINVYYNIYLKEYNELSDTWNYLVEPTSTPMNVGKGYATWASNALTGSTTVTYPGSLSNNDVIISTLDYTTGAPKEGFNLVGNPFPSAIDWNSNWSLSNLSGWMVIYDNGIYRGQHTDGTDYNDKTDGIIPSTQGFWVRALNSSASLTIPAAERLHSGQVFYKETTESIYPTVRLKSEFNDYIDEAVVIFHPECSPGFDGYYDLAKFTNVDEAPSLYTLSGDNHYGVNYYNENYEDVIIPLDFKTVEGGVYSISSDEIINFDEQTNVYLEDRQTGDVVNLLESPNYEFVYDPDFSDHRFNLHFKDSWYGMDEFDISSIKIFSYQKVIYIQLQGYDADMVTVSDIMGHEIFNTSVLNSGINKIPLNVEAGYYLVKVQSGSKSFSEKIFIK